jgi:hypothetical protein
MPYKSLSAPRRVESLDAEVCGAAAFDGAGLVAMVASSPARCAFVPIASGTNKVINLSLDRGDDIAFLSRDIAVVRSDGDLWAVLDIHHRAKFERVATNVRSLCGRPSGERALALTWEGHAYETTVSGYEVSARQFALRGTVKLADVGQTDTFVVVEVPGGGLELRMHPGATPEPGANGRAPLPSEASKLDRLKGGMALSVLYKRGSSEACIVSQTGGRLQAKMINVGSPIACAATSETSLVVAFEDGRAALFTGDTLKDGSDSTLTPTHSLSLGARGEPTTMLITSKGSANVWVGTSSGEIIRTSLPRR